LCEKKRVARVALGGGEKESILLKGANLRDSKTTPLKKSQKVKADRPVGERRKGPVVLREKRPFGVRTGRKADRNSGKRRNHL